MSCNSAISSVIFFLSWLLLRCKPYFSLILTLLHSDPMIQTKLLNFLNMFSYKQTSTIGLEGLESESWSVGSHSLWPHGLYSPWNSLGQNTGMDSLSILQGVFPTQGSNPGLPHFRQIVYQLSHQGRPGKPQVKRDILEKETRKVNSQAIIFF